MKCIVCEATLTVKNYGVYQSMVCPTKKCKATSWHWGHQIDVDKDNNIITYSLYITDSNNKEYNVYSSLKHNITVITHRPSEHDYTRILEIDCFTSMDSTKDLKIQVYEIFHRLMKLMVFS